MTPEEQLRRDEILENSINSLKGVKMKKEVHAAWIGALRSGLYNQTTGVLKRIQESASGRPVGMCCLGVLSDVVMKNPSLVPNVKLEWNEDNEDRANGIVELIAHSTDTGSSCHIDNVLPANLAQEMFMGRANQKYNPSQSAFFQLNDTLNMSFSEIADFIEKNVETY